LNHSLGVDVALTKLNSDVDILIDALELNFDPDLMLGNRSNPSKPRVTESQIIRV